MDPVTAEPVESVRWNADLNESFDVHLEHLKAETLTYDWVSRFIQVPIKRLFKNCLHVPTVHLGSFLKALEDNTLNDRLEDMRNISGGTERPPVYDVIELNAETKRDFMVEGIQFFEKKSGVKYVVQRDPTWSGMYFTIFSSVKDRKENTELCDRVWTQAIEQSYLRGAAFSISGKFLKRGPETWDDVFLEASQQRPLERVIETINERGAAMANRGVIMMGPPGTGKTLSARVIKNQAEATFIWVSARDFYRMGTFGGLSMAFDLGRQFAPTVICLEDIDNWLDSYSIDFLKTEMDGVDQSKGLAVLLTTNFPERFPEALIDRPGRFHDVINLGLPDVGVRQRMIAKWIPKASKQTVEKIAKATEGLSGAHIYELAKFAATLEEEDASLGTDAAVQQALEKVVEQRELIRDRHLKASQPNREEKWSAPDAGAVRFAVTSATFAAAKQQMDSSDMEEEMDDMDEETEQSIAPAVHAGNGVAVTSGVYRTEVQEGMMRGSEILQRIVASGHPHDPTTGRPFVDDVDTVAQAGSWRGSDMSIEFINVTRRGNERNRNGSLVQIVEGSGFKGLNTEFWESHRGTWLFGHGLMPGFQLPIGNSFNKKTGRVEFSKSKHRMTSRLFLSQTLPEAEVIAALIEEGVLNCCSVQFLPVVARELAPMEMEVPEGQDAGGLVAFGRPLPFDFLEADLYENSVVPIPADAHAIRKGIETGKIGQAKVIQSVLPALKMMVSDTPVQSGWTPKSQSGYRFYESLGEYQREIVTPDLAGMQSILSALESPGREDVTQLQPAMIQSAEAEPAVDYAALTVMIRQSGEEMLRPTPHGVDLQSVVQAVRAEFAPLEQRLQRTEDAYKQLTGRLD